MRTRSTRSLNIGFDTVRALAAASLAVALTGCALRLDVVPTPASACTTSSQPVNLAGYRRAAPSPPRKAFVGAKPSAAEAVAALATARTRCAANAAAPCAAAAAQATPMRSAAAALELWQVVMDLTSASLEATGAPDDVAATALVVGASDDWNRRLLKAVQQGGDDALVVILEERVHRAGAADAAGTDHDADTARFLAAYFKAYFRNGRVFAAELEVDQFAQAAFDAIKAGIPSDNAAAVLAELKRAMGKLCTQGAGKCFLSPALGDTKFVSRSGESIAFKGITATVGFQDRVQASLDYPKTSEFAPQMIRVAVEAVFDADADARVPAVASATACTSEPPLFPAKYCVAAAQGNARATGPADKIAEVDSVAGRADAVAAALAGEIIRGLSIASLNNEAVAKSVENLFGVTARKITERAAWRHATTGSGCVPSAPLAFDVSRR